MTRSEMIAYIKANPGIPIVHFMFNNNEHIIGTEDGNAYWADNDNYQLPVDWKDFFWPDGVWESGWYVKGDKTGTENCKWHIELPGHGICCDAYYHARDEQGGRYANFPVCECRNCPLKHPELLKGYVIQEV